jgi:hypothetical protein
MGKSGGAGLAILMVGGLAVLLLFSASIIGFVSGLGLPTLIQDFMDQIRAGIDSFPDGSGGGNFVGDTWIGYTVFFSDGTSQDIRQDPPPLSRTYSLVPLSISFSGKEVSSVRVDLKAQLSSDSVMGFWNATGGMKTEAFKMSDSAPRTAKTSSMVNYTKSGSSWANGEIKVLSSYTVPASQLENIVFTYGDGAWLLQFMAVLQINVTVDGVLIDLPIAVAPSGGMDFTYNNGVPTGFSVLGGSCRLSG